MHWEYLTVDVDAGPEFVQLGPWLNVRGRQGWELVAYKPPTISGTTGALVSAPGRCIFKRPLLPVAGVGPVSCGCSRTRGARRA